MSSASSDLDSLRDEMDTVTLEMVRLLARRLSLARRIGTVKQDLGMTVDDDRRETELRAKVTESCSHASEITAALRLLNFLLNESIGVQSEGTPKTAPHVAIFQEARRLEESGRKMLHMEIGEPDAAPAREVARALADACELGHTKYGTELGTHELRDAIAERESAFANVERNNVIVTMGARFAAYVAIESLLVAGDEIIIIEPAWPMYAGCAARAGIKVRRMRTTLESGWEPDASEIESAITPNTKMIVLNYPNNPTGKVLPAKLQDEIMRISIRHSLYVLSDEIYSAYSHARHKSALEFEYDRTIVTQSLSKSHAMTGFRMGYAVASPEVVLRMARLQGLCVVCPPLPMQHAALAALRSDPPDAARLTLRRLDMLAGMVAQSGLEFAKPDGAMYVFARLPRGLDGTAVAAECLKEGLAIAPGAGFGDYPGFVRLSACQDEGVLERGMDIINNVVSVN